ncbi:transposase family protein [Micromonospora sp. NPDC005161]
MPALPSSLISSLSDAPAVTVPEAAAGLPAALAGLPDPRARGGVRHRLTVVVTAAVCAVVAGYRSYAARTTSCEPSTPADCWSMIERQCRRRRQRCSSWVIERSGSPDRRRAATAGAKGCSTSAGGRHAGGRHRRD